MEQFELPASDTEMAIVVVAIADALVRKGLITGDELNQSIARVRAEYDQKLAVFLEKNPGIAFIRQLFGGGQP